MREWCTAASRRRLARPASVFAAALAGLLVAAPAPAEPPLNDKVRALVRAVGLGAEDAGVAAVDVTSGRILCAVNDERRMIPASNAKLLTTGAALLLLGEDFTFSTTAHADGRLAAGVLEGDLVIMAGGDPCIGGRGPDDGAAAAFDALAAKIAEAVTEVRGDLVVDGTIFDGQHVHPSWPEEQLVRAYCAPVSALAVNESCVFVRVKPGASPGRAARVFAEPDSSHVSIRNRCQTARGGRARAHIARLPRSDTIVVSGTLTPKSAGAAARVPVLEPMRYAGSVLRDRLQKTGVRITGKLVFARERTDVRPMTRLAAVEHPLADAVRRANKHSSNFHAEMIFKTLGRTVHAPASFEDGARAVAKALAHAGIPGRACRIDDGSGLSRENAVSAFHLACFLRYMALSESRETYVGSLPVAGVDGTLRRRMTRAPCKSRVHAKTGHLRGVSALSGYARADGRLIAFSVLVNGRRSWAGDRLQDRICRLLVDSAR
ncbi:MAG: D-alanyl-D-alanine carboxypeptidase/D-alanyl-D-alanine-endopeptidase [Planctomycetota bacterium]